MPKTNDIDLQNGFLVELFDLAIKLFYYTSAVELTKLAFRKAQQKIKPTPTKNELIRASNFAIDFFMITKWIFVLAIILNSLSNKYITYIIYYLIINNTFTYFYYHVWRKPATASTRKYQRRFFNATLAIGFYIICFAYLYMTEYSLNITWPAGVATSFDAIRLSMLSAFTLGADGFSIAGESTRTAILLEFTNTILFVSIILSESVPSGE